MPNQLPGPAASEEAVNRGQTLRDLPHSSFFLRRLSRRRREMHPASRLGRPAAAARQDR
jgi:hypothetical protein